LLLLVDLLVELGHDGMLRRQVARIAAAFSPQHFDLLPRALVFERRSAGRCGARVAFAELARLARGPSFLAGELLW
jgi:hypothetical protein